MRNGILLAVFAVGLGVAGARAEYKPYPGAKFDAALQKKSAQEVYDNVNMLAKTTALITADPFENVVAFYQKLGREFKMPAMPGLWDNGYERELPAAVKMGPRGFEIEPSGVRVKVAYFILDGAAEFDESKDSVTITSPVVMEVTEENGRMRYGNIVKGTSVVHVQEK